MSAIVVAGAVLLADASTPDVIVTSGFSSFAEYIPAVATAAIGVTVLIWGIHKLVGLFKSLA